MSNPLLKNNIFKSEQTENNEVMTISGVINKTFILLGLLFYSSIYSLNHIDVFVPLLPYLLIFSFVLAMILIFKKTISMFLSPIYAICEGLILGTISLFFEKMYPGIVFNGIVVTICSLFCMLAAYKTGIIKVTQRFKSVMMLSMFSICLFYIVSLLFNIFGFEFFRNIHNNSNLSIVSSIFISIVASLSLIIDFDLIEHSIKYKAHKYMEWYCAFSLIVTLIWLYIEVIRLLSKLSSNKN
ncbi:MAG: Bax inhibitor-1/YccA family protein [Endomicrobium sp.]|jgi:uncharacterized YccA/Bax inhibitor family protein|nr:Bax inhibitor-1/YccA family protein [Endomicrobium sp.]